MIELYSGTPGSGKSYHATSRIFYWLRNRKVIANYGLYGLPEKKSVNFLHRSNENLTVDNLIKFAEEYHVQRKEHQTLIVIDEAGIKFNSREWNNKDRLKWLDFFSQHRKYGFDIVLIAQADIMLDKQLRQFIENEVNHRNLLSCPFPVKIIAPVYRFAAVKWWYSNKMPLGVEYIRYSKKIGNLYNSFEGFEWKKKKQQEAQFTEDIEEIQNPILKKKLLIAK